MNQSRDKIVCQDIKCGLHGIFQYKRRNLTAMIKQYLAAENMELSPHKLTLWREIIQFERDELQNDVLLLENMC